MSLVCVVAVACSLVGDAGDLTCEIVKSECMSVTDERETEMHVACDKAANCVEMTKRIFVIRESVTTVPIPPVRGGGKA